MEKPLARTVGALISELAFTNPRVDSIVDGAKRYSYSELVVEVETAGRALIASGIVHGDRVGILAGNRAEWIIIDLAIMHIGAISVGLNTWSSANELAYQLDHAAVRLLFVEPRFREQDFIDLIEQARALASKNLEALGEVIVFDTDDALSCNWDEFITRATQSTAGELNARSNAVRAADVACLLYTSGSTALPKGVPLLHGGLIDNMWEIGERQHLVAGDRLWLAVSLFWSLASVNALFALLTHRGTIVLQHHFEPGPALALIAREKCTVFYGTPNMTLALMEDEAFDITDLSSFRTGVTIGTPAQVQRVADIGVTEICNVYGLTEAYGNSTVSDSSLPLALRVETVGRALEGIEVRIIDPQSGVRLPAGEAGEITLKGNVTPGYWHDKERTREAFDALGWFHTGDRGFLDADGYLFYRGRLKEMVKTGGINVAPAEVEQVLSQHPAIELAFVTGIPDTRLDEALAAVIVLRTGEHTDAASLKTHCRETLAAYKAPRHYRFVDATSLPLTSTGKLQRNRLVELFNN